MGIYITGDWKLPVIMVGFGMFLLFDRVTFHNRAINRIAQSAFAVYLITDYAASEKLLWTRLFNLQDLYQQPFAILQILGILLTIYAICILIDFARQALFAFTIDRRRGTGSTCCRNEASHLRHNRNHTFGNKQYRGLDPPLSRPLLTSMIAKC